jgi:metal-sulfur cluster biosynthetic enzyme
MNFTEAVLPEFSSLFAAWIRLEPRCRLDDFSRGLQACLADPLWLLTRQWQLGEFKGENAGSPIKVELAYQSAKLAKVSFGSPPAEVTLGDQPPLEALVEREPINTDSWRIRLQIGQKFERLLRENYPDAADAIIHDYRLLLPVVSPIGSKVIDTDYATQRFLQMMAGRVIDGDQLLKIDESENLPKLPEVVTITKQDVWRLIQDFLIPWLVSLYSEPLSEQGKAWNPETMDYSFKVISQALNAQQEKLSLSASSYRNGELDWYTFSAGQPVQNWGSIENQKQTYPPTRVNYPGGPNLRWWAFEDNRVDFGSLDVATTDLIKNMLMEYALIGGDDWFILPLELEMGSVSRIKGLNVKDVFGEKTEVTSACSPGNDPLKQFAMFYISERANPTTNGSDFLLLPPVIGFREESPPLEEIHFLRDEGANMVWAVEHTVQNSLGDSIAGFDAQLEKRTREQEFLKIVIEALKEVKDPKTGIDIISSNMVHSMSLEDSRRLVFSLVLKDDVEEDHLVQLKTAAGEAAKVGGIMDVRVNLRNLVELHTDLKKKLPRYRLATTVPANWIPFIPMDPNLWYASQDQTFPSVKLCQAQMLRNEEDQAPVPIRGFTRLLKPTTKGGVLMIDEEAVLRAGVRLQLTAQRVRWIDGKTYVWLGRKVLAGRGEGNSGLRFDFLAE